MSPCRLEDVKVSSPTILSLFVSLVLCIFSLIAIRMIVIGLSLIKMVLNYKSKRLTEQRKFLHVSEIGVMCSLQIRNGSSY